MHADCAIQQLFNKITSQRVHDMLPIETNCFRLVPICNLKLLESVYRGCGTWASAIEFNGFINNHNILEEENYFILQIIADKRLVSAFGYLSSYSQ